VLTSLHAELRYREEVLRTKKAKDLLELERKGDPDTPPSLVVVVDEFAALVSEVPQFVDGVVDVAQRGRSLGLHLVLATQRPAGVIKDNLRANTNMRIALRMADSEDSADVVGSPAAGDFDPSTPGRALAKTGPGRLVPFQSAYVGGWTADTPEQAAIEIVELRFGVATPWELPEDDGTVVSVQTGPNDLHRIVETVRAAHQATGMERPRRPWLDELAKVYDLTKAPQSRTDSELIFGLYDEPAKQRQRPVSFLPDQDGNMAVYGTGGSGKSTFLRTLAVVAGLSWRGGPCHVYGLDFGARGLQMLETLPHVGAIVNGDDHERVVRLLRWLREEIDTRSARYAKVNAGSIQDYRQAADKPDEPRILVLVDGIAAFRQAYEVGERARWFDVFQAIASDGRQVGVHIVVSADRNASLPPGLAAVVQRRLVLRLANEVEYGLLSAPPDAFSAATPPGRGFLDDGEVQVYVLGGTANTARQAAAIARLAETMPKTVDRTPAPAIGRLPERVRLGDLPAEVDGAPALGIADDTLAPVGFAFSGAFAVVGPPGSGKTSVLATLALSVQRAQPKTQLIRIGPRPSPLQPLARWSEQAQGADEAAALAAELAERLVAGGNGQHPVFIVVESLPEFLDGPADMPLQELFRAARVAGAVIATDAETSAMASSWPLLQAVKASRHGIALQPDQIDGEAVFKTPFPRLSRPEFPPGRGLYVRGGRILRVQCALPEVDPA
jgi:S-DNA-T family DNA segregation ATPase FtsK/SpoIIIE